jgi:hypothetical protein
MFSGIAEMLECMYKVREFREKGGGGGGGRLEKTA